MRVSFLAVEQGPSAAVYSSESLVGAFKIYDRNGDKLLSRDDIRTVLSRRITLVRESQVVTDEMLDQILKLYTLDADGKLNYLQFIKGEGPKTMVNILNQQSHLERMLKVFDKDNRHALRESNQ